ncbi:MAG: hypothetical protein JWP80_963 [Pseudomonas sp.]|nr:hypothetical protein [Pseudomonas sp.]
MISIQYATDSLDKFLHKEWIIRARGKVLFACLLCLMAGALHAQPGTPTDVSDKRTQAVTRIVLGILSYARWPVEPEELHVCLVGSTEYTDDLVKGTLPFTGRNFVVRKLPVGSPVIALECNVVYLGRLSTAERTGLFDTLSIRPVLSISEDSEQCTVGSLFCLRFANEQVSFDVNIDSIARSGVRIHPSVLQLSHRQPAGQ